MGISENVDLRGTFSAQIDLRSYPVEPENKRTPVRCREFNTSQTKLLRIVRILVTVVFRSGVLVLSHNCVINQTNALYLLIETAELYCLKSLGIYGFRSVFAPSIYVSKKHLTQVVSTEMANR